MLEINAVALKWPEKSSPQETVKGEARFWAMVEGKCVSILNTKSFMQYSLAHSTASLARLRAGNSIRHQSRSQTGLLLVQKDWCLEEHSHNSSVGKIDPKNRQAKQLQALPIVGPQSSVHKVAKVAKTQSAKGGIVKLKSPEASICGHIKYWSILVYIVYPCLSMFIRECFQHAPAECTRDPPSQTVSCNAPSLIRLIPWGMQFGALSLIAIQSHWRIPLFREWLSKITLSTPKKQHQQLGSKKPGLSQVLIGFYKLAHINDTPKNNATRKFENLAFDYHRLSHYPNISQVFLGFYQMEILSHPPFLLKAPALGAPVDHHDTAHRGQDNT